MPNKQYVVIARYPQAVNWLMDNVLVRATFVPAIETKTPSSYLGRVLIYSAFDWFNVELGESHLEIPVYKTPTAPLIRGKIAIWLEPTVPLSLAFEAYGIVPVKFETTPKDDEELVSMYRENVGVKLDTMVKVIHLV